MGMDAKAKLLGTRWRTKVTILSIVLGGNLKGFFYHNFDEMLH